VTAEAPKSAPALTAAEALGWVGFAVDCADGAPAGRVHSVFVDTESGAPAWLVVARVRRGFLGRRRAAGAVAVPARECAGAAGRVWTALPSRALGSAPTVDPGRPLLREHELAIGAHYGIGEGEGRCAEVAGRGEGAGTAQPAA
jgi:hypothetical protein